MPFLPAVGHHQADPRAGWGVNASEANTRASTDTQEFQMPACNRAPALLRLAVA
jgi:hypothetical protein